MKKLLDAYKKLRYKSRNSDSSDYPWLAQAVLRHADATALDGLGLKATDRARYAGAGPVGRIRILSPYLQAAAKAEEKAKGELEFGRLGEALSSLKDSAKAWAQGIRFSPEKLFALAKASSAKSLAFRLGGKTQLHFPLLLIRRILADLKGLRDVSVNLMRKDNRLCFSYLNEGGRPGHMRLNSHAMAEDPQKVLSVDLRPCFRPAQVMSSPPALRLVAVVSKPVAMPVPWKGRFMAKLADWFEELGEDLR